ncbi:hypothetical protein U1Q18_004225 [Sarracenia purpurea var. burkii]
MDCPQLVGAQMILQTPPIQAKNQQQRLRTGDREERGYRSEAAKGSSRRFRHRNEIHKADFGGQRVAVAQGRVDGGRRWTAWSVPRWRCGGGAVTSEVECLSRRRWNRTALMVAGVGDAENGGSAMVKTGEG